MGMMSGLYYSAAALFQAIPAWLRFLESLRLIDAGTSGKVTAELLPLHATPAADLGAAHRGSAPVSPRTGVAGLAVADRQFPLTCRRFTMV